MNSVPSVPSEQPGNTSPTNPSSVGQSVRWKPAAIILLTGVLLQIVGLLGFEPDRTKQSFSIWVIVLSTASLLLGWWIFFSGLSRKKRASGIAFAAVVAGILCAVVRVDGFSGEMFPLFAWRWSATPQEIAKRRGTHLVLRPVEKSPVAVDEHREIKILPEDWPCFRGNTADGVVRGSTLRRDWDQHPPQLVWRHPVGAGWSSFAVVDHLAVTQEQRGEMESVVCYDFDTGRELWAHGDESHFMLHPAGEGPRATPTIFDGRVYTVGAKGLLNCLTLEKGKLLWSHDILTENGAKSPEWGVAGSPLVFDELVVVNAGGEADNGVVAYNRITGEKVWSAGRDQMSYVTPQLAVLAGRKEVLIFDTVGLAGHDAVTGVELWKSPWTNNPKINATQPVVIDDRHVFFSSGYGKGFSLIFVKDFGDANSQSVREYRSGRHFWLKFNNPVLYEGHLYALEEGILTCFSVPVPERKWKQGRYGFGQILLVGNVLLIQAESGEVALVEATPEGHKEITRFQALTDNTWNYPVLCRGRLLVRNNIEAACYDVSETQ